MPIVVNGQSVDEAVLDAEFAEIKAYHERLGNVSCCERDPEFREYARQNIIARVLLSQEARQRLGSLPDAEIDAAVEKLQEAHGGKEAFLAAIGGTPEQMELVRRDVEADLRVHRMLDNLADPHSRPGEQELLSFYEKHLDQFMTDEQVRASHILKAPARGENRQGSYDAFRSIRTQLLGGADFDELARQHSDKASEHIDLGFFKRGELPEEFEVIAFSMVVGEVSPVFGSPYGYHLIKLTERRPSVSKPFEEVREAVRQRLLDDRRANETRQLVESLKQTAKIEEITPALADA